MSGMTSEWDSRRAAANLKKDHVAFADAATVFLDPLAMTFLDPEHSSDERDHHRLYIEGPCGVRFHCELGEQIRIIGARRATRTERKQYEEGIDN
jgi:uncharacterized DUF497 family protein